MGSYMTSIGGTLRELSSAIPRGVRCRGTIRTNCCLPLKIAFGCGCGGLNFRFADGRVCENWRAKHKSFPSFACLYEPSPFSLTSTRHTHPLQHTTYPPPSPH